MILTWSLTVNVLFAKLLKNLVRSISFEETRKFYRLQTYDLKYFATGSAAFSFI